MEYEIIDMFAEEPFGGSPLAVVPGAGELATETMAAIARELNQPETAFVVEASTRTAEYSVRIFTTEGESPFGGHSSIGTATTLVRLGILAAGPLVQHCGPRSTVLHATAGRADLTVNTPLAGTELDAAELLAAVGLEVASARGPARAEGFGPAFHYLPVAAEAVLNAQWDPSAAGELDDVYVFAWDDERRQADARMFAPGYAMPEDPACASAALGLARWLGAAGHLPARSGTYRYAVEQQTATGRRSWLDCAATVTDGQATSATVTGTVLPSASGRVCIRTRPVTDQRDLRRGVTDAVPA